MRLGKCLVVMMVVVLVLAGCGGKKKKPAAAGGGGSSSGPTAPETQKPGVVKEGRVVVDIMNLKFTPAKLSIPTETQVVWTNSDDVDHSVNKRKGPGADFNSGPLQPGSTFSQVLDERGTYEIADEETEGGPEMEIVVEEKTGKAPPAPEPAPPPGG